MGRPSAAAGHFALDVEREMASKDTASPV